MYRYCVSLAFFVAAAAGAAPAEVNEMLDSSADARTVLACHESYVKKFSAILPALSATDVAIGAKAHCADEARIFEKNLRAGRMSNAAEAWLLPESIDRHIDKFNDYKFSYTVDLYLKSLIGEPQDDG